MANLSTATAATPKTSAYARSRALRWGMWVLVVAGVLIAWNSIKGSRVAKTESLQTLEGTVIDYRTGISSPKYGVTSGKRFRGSARPRNVLRIQTSDGTITEFSSEDWIAPPKFGWRKGQPIRVKHDAGRDLYEVVVANETLKDIATTQQKRRDSGKTTQTFAVLLLVIGLPLTAVGFLLSFQKKPGSASTSTTPPPLPGSSSPS